MQRLIDVLKGFFCVCFPSLTNSLSFSSYGKHIFAREKPCHVFLHPKVIVEYGEDSHICPMIPCIASPKAMRVDRVDVNDHLLLFFLGNESKNQATPNHCETSESETEKKRVMSSHFTPPVRDYARKLIFPAPSYSATVLPTGNWPQLPVSLIRPHRHTGGAH